MTMSLRALPCAHVFADTVAVISKQCRSGNANEGSYFLHITSPDGSHEVLCRLYNALDATDGTQS